MTDQHNGWTNMTTYRADFKAKLLFIYILAILLEKHNILRSSPTTTRNTILNQNQVGGEG